MSLRCTHLDGDAAAHPECAGCQLLLRQLFVHQVETEQEIHQAALRGESRESVARRLAERHAAGLTPRGYRRMERSAVVGDDGEMLQRWTSSNDARVRPGHLAGAGIRGHRAERVIFDDPMLAPQPLLDRDPTPEDLEAERDQPRPGVWAGEPGADLRALTQDETDALVRMELFASASPAEVNDVLAAIGGHVELPEWNHGPIRNFRSARVQRGGIDSDPLVRVLARRAWGDRDRQWFDLRGVRKGDALTSLGGSPNIQRAWPGEHVIGVATCDSGPGADYTNVSSAGVPVRNRVSDRLREPPGHEVYDRINRAMLPAFVFDGEVNPGASASFAEYMLNPAVRRTNVMSPDAYRMLDEHVVRTALERGDRPQDVARDVARTSQYTASEVSEIVREQTRQFFETRDMQIDTSSIPIAKAKQDAPPRAKPAPPVPRWAKKRRERQPPPPPPRR